MQTRSNKKKLSTNQAEINEQKEQVPKKSKNQSSKEAQSDNLSKQNGQRNSKQIKNEQVNQDNILSIENNKQDKSSKKIANSPQPAPVQQLKSPENKSENYKTTNQIDSFVLDDIKNSNAKKGEDIKISLGSFIQKHEINIDEYLSNFEGKLKLGSGHYSEVYKIKSKEKDIFRAMKIINKKKIPFNEKEAFLREIQILKKLDHPNILKLYEFLEDEQNYYLITEYCEGKELFDVIQDNCESLQEKDIASILQQILQALTYAHSNKIMHRDIKPENIMISQNIKNNTFLIKLVDWGIGSDFGTNDSTSSTKCGTPYYAAPEVIKKKYNEKCDIWSTGVIMYTLLVQEIPFSGESTTDIIQNVLSKFQNIVIAFKFQIFLLVMIIENKINVQVYAHFDLFQTNKDANLQDLFFVKTKQGQYEMKGDDWDKVSDDAKDLVRKMLCYNYETRLSAEECLKHPWFKQNLSQSLSKQNLKKFKAQSQLQKAAMSFIVSHLISEKDKEQFSETFKLLDENGDGQLSKAEIMNGYKKVWSKGISDQEINKIFDQIDVNQSGYIDYTEFITAAIDASVFTEQEKLKEAFSLFDKDGDGFITEQEIKNVLGIGMDIDEETWKKIVAEVDENGDGQISFEEFKKIMQSIVTQSSKPKRKNSRKKSNVMMIDENNQEPLIQ